jgi:hypothetical protein
MNKETYMTKFDKSKFTYYSGYLMYDGQFVARFKYSGPFSKGVFLKQLLKNHTVEEYFHKHQVQNIAPLTILEQADPKWSETTMAKWKAKIEQRYGVRPIRILTTV